MSAPQRRAEQEGHTARQTHGIKAIDSGELRAVIIVAAALAVFFYYIKLILLPFVLAAAIGYLCTPVLDWLAWRTRWPRLIFVVAAFALLVGLGALVAMFAAEHAITALRHVGSDLQNIVEKSAQQALGNGSINLFGHRVDAQEIAQTMLNRMAQWLGQAKVLMLMAGYGIGSAMGVVLALVLLFYFLVSGRQLARGVLWITPPRRRNLVERIWARLDPMLFRYFAGVLAIVIYATIVAYIGLALILHVKHAPLLAVMTGLLETIPVIGPILSGLIAGLFALQTTTSITSIIAYAAYAIALRLSIDQLLGPLVLGSAARLHPVIIIFGTLVGGIVYGVPGVILAVPVTLAVKSTIAVLYEEGS